MRYRQQSAVIVAILTIALPRHVRWVLRTSDTFTILPPSLFLRFRTARSQTPRTHPRDCASHGSSLLASLLGSSVSSGTSSIIVYEVLCSCFVLSISRDIAHCVCLRCTVRPLTQPFFLVDHFLSLGRLSAMLGYPARSRPDIGVGR